MEATLAIEDAALDNDVSQLQPRETLIDRGVADALDEGLICPDHYSPAMGFGSTVAEMRRGETLDMRLKQEEPEKVIETDDWNPLHENRQVGAVRAGRLIADTDGSRDIGLGGGAACAEEAAMYVIDDQDDEVRSL